MPHRGENESASDSRQLVPGYFPDLSRPGPVALCNRLKGGYPGQGEKPLSALEIGVDHLRHIVDRHAARLLLAIDEKGRGRVDAELGGGPLARLVDAVKHLLIRHAGLETLVGEAELLDGEV